MTPLESWIERQYRHSASALLRSVSAVDIVKHRPGFAQVITPRKGSIVASPVPAAYDPEPDYFFHWLRDSAVVIDALRILFEDPGIEVDALTHFSDFVHFSLSLQALDGRVLVRAPSWRTGIAAEYQQFVRDDNDLSQAHGEAVAAETRVNPDGSLDISKWPRPQNDGPAMRVIACLGWKHAAHFDAQLERAVDELLRADLSFIRRHWRDACFDIWEEEKGFHYYTLRVAAAALERGSEWYQAQHDTAAAEACRIDANAILQSLNSYWREDLQFYRSRVLEGNAPSSKELDIAVILAALHAAGKDGPHSVGDPRMHATLRQLEALFDAQYPINRNRGARAPAMGRYLGDVYYSGGAYYFSTLGAAEFCFRAAAAGAGAGVAGAGAGAGAGAVAGVSSPSELFRHGDAFLETVRAYLPESGDMAEQFDQKTGAPRSAQQLAWSYAAFISCIEARRRLISRGE